MSESPNLIDQAAEVIENVQRDPLYKSLRKMHLTLTSRRFLYFFLTTLEIDESCKKAHVTRGHAASILSEFSKSCDLQKLMAMVGLDDMSVLAKMAALLNAKREVITLKGEIRKVDAPDIQAKVLDIAVKSKGWYSDGMKNLNVFAPVLASETKDELNAIE
jgi:hypothetical protein